MFWRILRWKHILHHVSDVFNHWLSGKIKMSGGLKKSPSNGFENSLTPEAQQAKVLPTNILVWFVTITCGFVITCRQIKECKWYWLWVNKSFWAHGTMVFGCLQINEVRRLVGPLPEKLSIYCSDASISRHLRARNWSVKKTTKMLKETLKWRAEYKPEEIRWVCYLFLQSHCQ